MILTFCAILSGAGLAVAWSLIAPPILARIATSRFGRAIHSRGALALLLVLPFAGIAAWIATNGPSLQRSVTAATAAPSNPALDEARKEAPHDLEAAVKELETKLAQNPNDQDGWRLLARSYTELGQADKAADAARHAAALGGKAGDAEAQSAHGEDLVTAAQGTVTPEARQAFQAALAGDPSDPRARFFMGLAAAQDGKNDDALQDWLTLERDSPPDAPWLEGLRSNIDRLAEQAGVTKDALAKRRSLLASTNPAPVAQTAPALAAPSAPPMMPGAGASPGIPGPTSADVAAAANMSADDRQTMIRSMVQRLADRMQQNPGDVDGWLRLGRAYGVLGDKDKALDAFHRATEADPSRADARQAYADAQAATGTK